MTLTEYEVEILKAAIVYRRAYVEEFRAAPNISCGDNWDSVVHAMDNADRAVDTELLDELDDYSLSELQTGLQLLAIDGWCPIEDMPPEVVTLNRLIGTLRKD